MYTRCRCGRVYPQRLAGGDGSVDCRLIPFRTVDQQFGETECILGPDAAMTECTHLLREQRLRRRVVQVDGIIVRHHQLHPTERVRGSWRLAVADLVAVLDGHVALLATHLRRDALRNFPPGIDDDAGGDRGELGRRSRGLADHHFVACDHVSVLDQCGSVGGHVDDDVAVTEIAREPAPAVEVAPVAYPSLHCRKCSQAAA